MQDSIFVIPYSPPLSLYPQQSQKNNFTLQLPEYEFGENRTVVIERNKDSDKIVNAMLEVIDNDNNSHQSEVELNCNAYSYCKCNL